VGRRLAHMDMDMDMEMDMDMGMGMDMGRVGYVVSGVCGEDGRVVRAREW
jgi:hypothetical protein